VKLRPGEPAPDFEVDDAEERTWRLRDLRGKRVIIYFYPADDTPGCTAEACDFRDFMGDFDAAGYTVLGVSPQGADSHRAFAQKYGLNFPLLIDEDLSLARNYGATRNREDEYKGIPLRVARSTFVIDEHGVVVEALYGVKAPGHVESLKEKLAI
jgi:thioredoxin-dependent peroxiredoxin